jgi:MscS family membrane protein
LLPASPSELAASLKKIIDKQGLKIDLRVVPKDSNYVDPATGLNRYYPFSSSPEIYLQKVGTKWLISQETIESIPELAGEDFQSPVTQVTNWMPAFTRVELFGMHLWQYFGIILYLILGYFLYSLFRWIIKWILMKIAQRTKFKDTAIIFIKPISKPISLFIVINILWILLPFLLLTHEALQVCTYILAVFIPISITGIIYRIVDIAAQVTKKLALRNKSSIDNNLIPLARKILKIIVVIFGGIYVLKALNIDITPLIAGVSIGGLALALAAQETVKNLFGSITIFTDQPFEAGDWIVFDGREGNVEEVGIRSTRIRTFYNSIITVPNGKLADMMIDNMGKREIRRYRTKLSLVYGTPAEKITQFIDGLRKIILNHKYTHKENYSINVSDLSESSIDIIFTIFFVTQDGTLEADSRQEIILSILDLAKNTGVEFAYPTRSLHLTDDSKS